MVAKSTSWFLVDVREQNLIPSVTRELALVKGWYKGVSSANYLTMDRWMQLNQHNY